MKKSTLSILFISWLSISALGQAAYVEFKLVAPGDGISGTTKIYCLDSSTRTEINMSSPQIPAGISQATLILKDNHQRAYVLDEKNKTYTGIDLSNTSAMEKDPSQYEVSVIGKEKVNGYACTHVKIKRKDSTLGGQELWVSAEIPNYKQFMNVKSKYTTEGIFKALRAKGVLGFIVRIIVGEKDKTMQIDLVKAELRNIDASLFSLAGYQEQMPPVAPEGAPNVQEIAKKVQNMSPEERQRFIEELKKKQQQKNSETTPTSPH